MAASGAETDLVSFGIVGCAAIAQKNVRAIQLSSNADISACASRAHSSCVEFITATRAKTKTKTGSLPRAIEGYQALLDDPLVEAVYIPLPTKLHLEWAVKAAEAKKHILLEKPTATNLEELLKIVQACCDKGLQFMDGVMFMHHDRLQCLSSLVGDPLFGPVKRVGVNFSFAGSQAFLNGGDIRTRPDGDPLGCVGDLGWYCIRIALVAFQYRWPTYVCARASVCTPDGIPLDVSGEVVFEEAKPDTLEPPHVLTFHCSFLHPNRQYVEIVGDTRVITFDDFVIARSEAEVSLQLESFPVAGPLIDRHCRVASRIDTYRFQGCRQEQRMIENFADCVKHIRSGKQADLFWPHVSIQTQSVLDAVMRSVRKDGAREQVEVPKGWSHPPTHNS
ncbi:unnamed protein product [Vitrella brassicaformis CCMP3155]|uniref:Gfo/Idh/MocA-like oxidoreductase N-terminal domain-containing protein n=2 Tax=Vitrella brassicaformis TaxID=1169539 RepID=A0A0G4EH98_VITBC|nr:unnamed protein product [Vitrella brassicaformis CCMP3155]|eukprot:CEL95352.1 unnamed protein product [Vitrella brassicaformis CCMP3155]